MASGELVEYSDGVVQFVGYHARPKRLDVAAPFVLVAPMWSGRCGFADSAADRLAALGYHGFAIDMYGGGRRGATPEESGALMRPLVDDRLMLRRRALAAVQAASQLGGVDGGRGAAIGFCFGGMVALDLARAGAPLRGVVSFHGLPSSPEIARPSKIDAEVLVLHGHDDPMARPDAMAALTHELDEYGARWELQVYGGTMHAFTNPAAAAPERGTLYCAKVAARAWAASDRFLAEVLG